MASQPEHTLYEKTYQFLIIHINRHILQTQLHSFTNCSRNVETGAHSAFCLIALLLLFSVKGRKRKGSCTNKFSSIYWLQSVRQGFLFCVPQRHSAFQLPHLHTQTHTHTLIYIQGEFKMFSIKFIKDGSSYKTKK